MLDPTTYEAGAAGKTCRDGQEIASDSFCRDAAEKLGYTYAQSEMVANFPGGCYVGTDGRSVFFNMAEGTTRSDSLPVCVGKLL